MRKLIAQIAFTVLSAPSLAIAAASNCEDAFDSSRSLEDAIGEAEGSNRRVTFVLAGNCILGDNLALASGRLIIVGDGFEIDLNEFSFEVLEGGELQLNDVNLDNTDGEYAAVYTSGGDLKLNDVYAMDVTVYVDGGTATINGGEISGSSYRGVGVDGDGKVSINGSVISDNRYGLIVATGVVALNASEISGSGQHGIVFAGGGGSVSLNKGTVITGNGQDGIRSSGSDTVEINADACVVGNGLEDLHGGSNDELFVSRRATVGTCSGFGGNCPSDVDGVDACALIY